MTTVWRKKLIHVTRVLAAASLVACHALASASDKQLVETRLEQEAGAPLSHTFAPAEYGGSAQNWAVVQDLRGVIYVGNTEDGVLEFDGTRWRRIPVGNGGPVLSLAVDTSGRVYVGGVGEVGYLAADSEGRMRYVSLTEHIPAADRDFADVFKTYATSEGVYFCTFRRIIRIAGDRVTVWNGAPAFHFAFHVHGTIFAREVGKGLMKLSGDEFRLVAGGERFADEKIYAVLPWPSSTTDASILIGTQTQGWFIYDGTSFHPWQTQADALIKHAGLYDALWLADGRLVAITLESGAVVLDMHGRLLDHIDRHSGLSSDVAYGAFQDRQGGLWLPLDRGIARVEIATPLTYLAAASGIEGSTLAIHRHAGMLYAGTTQGLYRLQCSQHGPAYFERVRGIRGETLGFLEHRDRLLIASREGVFELRNGAAQRVWSGAQGASVLVRSAHDPQRVFIGKQNGLSAMRFVGGHWLDQGSFPGIADDVRSMFQEGNRLWLATTTGVLSVTLDESQQFGTALVTQVERFGHERGLPRGYSYVVGAIDGQPRFATAQGIQLYDAGRGKFTPDPRFWRLFEGKQRRVLHFEQDSHGHVWMRTMAESGTVREIGAAVLQGDGRYTWDPNSLDAIAGEVIDEIYADAAGVVWLGGEDAVYRYDSRLAAGRAAPFDALVREVSTRAGKLVFGGAGAAVGPTFDYSQNALRFEFAAPGADLRPARFQVYLEGADDDWIPWSTQAHREYTNLREGTYRFQVRAMSSSGAVSRAQPYEFRVLPPWYRTWLAYAAYLTLLAVLVALVSRWRSLALTRRNRELAMLVGARTRELESANAALTELSVTDSVTGLKNRRYLIERIEHDVGVVRRAYAERRLDPLRAQDANIDLLFILVDIDHFKQVNDHYGHAAGDLVLQQFARILQSVCRETDTAVRWGGEEFLLLARFANSDSGPLIAERIRALTASHVFLLPEGKTLRRTCSIGFASFPLCLSAPEQFTWEDAVELADQCLYESKHSGRNTWVGVYGTQKAPRDRAFERLADLDVWVAEGALHVLRPPTSVERSDTAA